MSLLGPLFVYGAFNAHNDAFTYLAHSNWLQHNAFRENILTEMVTPLNGQVFVYQKDSLRMGGSFLLALTQSLFNLEWSYEAYPAVNIAAITACCLTIGFPLMWVLRTIPRIIRIALLALPACSLGGLVFGANLGFLPQTVGLAFMAGVLFAFGPLLRCISTSGESIKSVTKMTIPIALFFAAAVYAYSEITPFLFAAVVGSAFLYALRFRAWGKVTTCTGILLLFSILLLNTELSRAYVALKLQSSAITGVSVNWSLPGYFAHALGTHGGVWDGFQWSLPEGSGLFAIGVNLSLLVIALIILGGRAIWRAILNGTLMPSIVVLMLFFVGLIYFRYFAPSPFTQGVGQSWSQFKLSDWAHPFVMAFVLLAIASFQPRLKKFFNCAALLLFVTGITIATLIGVLRARHLIQYYDGTRNLNRFYQEFRQTVINTCQRETRVYLALNGFPNTFFRRMSVYFLPDREVVSDWMDEIYIYPWLPPERRTQTLQIGDCVVEPIGQGGLLAQGQGVTTGPFRIGIFDGRQGRVRIASITGAYDRESDSNNWWHWVEHKVTFQLQPLFIPKDSTHTRLHFEYMARDKQKLNLQIIKRNGSSQEIILHSKGDVRETFEDTINLPSCEIAAISIETNGKASPLSKRDLRMVTFSVINMTITPFD